MKEKQRTKSPSLLQFSLQMFGDTMTSSVSKQKARKTFREIKYFFHKSDLKYNIEAWGVQQTQFTGIDGSEKSGLLEAWVLDGLWSWLRYTI